MDATHPLDLYADFEPPDRPGLLLITSERPPECPAARSISLTVGRRNDGRWALRMSLEVPLLLAVFAELSRDIIESTRTGVPDSRAATAFLQRIDRWRRLLEQGIPDLSPSAIRGLIGELTVLSEILIPVHGARTAVSAWIGPLGAPQDFILPTGERLEAKALGRNADTVRISGLAQLDPGSDTMKLVVVRLEDTAPTAEGALTLARLVGRTRTLLADEGEAARDFERLLAVAGWSAEKDPGSVAVRVAAIEGHEVDEGFPRLVLTSVPSGVVNASYEVRLPDKAERWVGNRWISGSSGAT